MYLLLCVCLMHISINTLETERQFVVCDSVKTLAYTFDNLDKAIEMAKELQSMVLVVDVLMDFRKKDDQEH